MHALARFFIRRPVGSAMLAAAIVLAGLLALRLLPVAPLPRVDFPVIQVRASLPGASPESMAVFSSSGRGTLVRRSRSRQRGMDTAPGCRAETRGTCRFVSRVSWD